MRIQLAILFAIVASAAVASAEIERLKNLDELYNAAKRLESAHMQVTESRQAYAEQRTRLVYAFARESKSSHCNQLLKQLVKTIEDYRTKAYQFVTDAKKPGGWLAGFKKMVGPLNAMRGISKFDPYLASVTARYESQERSGILTSSDVDCDMAKLHARSLDKMLFVLKTDIKYLIMEDPQVSNIAIYRRLAENKFIANTNFYDTDKLTDAQRRLLFDFYVSRVDPNKVSIGEAVEHYNDPSPLIVGRLLDSCHKFTDLQSFWHLELEPKRQAACEQSKSDLANESFHKEFSWTNYNDVADFCGPLLDSL